MSQRRKRSKKKFSKVEMNCWKVASASCSDTYPRALAARSSCVVTVPVLMFLMVNVLPAATTLDDPPGDLRVYLIIMSRIKICEGTVP